MSRGDGSFRAARNSATGSEHDKPSAVAIGNLTGDRKPDLAIAGFGFYKGLGITKGSGIIVQTNKGGGRFRTERRFVTAAEPEAVAIGELNGDRKPDLVAVSHEDDAASVLLNKGGGRFAAKVDYRTGAGPVSIAIGDLTGDHKPELVTTNSNANTVSLLVNKGNGTFEPKRDFRAGRNPTAVAIGDLNADGKPDVAAVNNWSNTISVLANRGGGSFAPKRDFPTARGPDAAGATAVDCQHVAVWTPGKKAIARFTPPAGCEGGSTGPPGVSDVELAGSRAAWVWHGGGNQWSSVLRTASLTHPLTVDLSDHSRDAGEIWDYRLRGDGELLVFNEGSRIMRIAAGREKCQERALVSTSVCRTIRRGDYATQVDSVSRGRIAVREATEIAVVDAQGKVVRVFTLKASSAWLDGDDLIVTRANVIERYRIASGARNVSRPLPSGYKVADVDGGTAVLREARVKARSIKLLRLDDGRSVTVARRGPMFADLEGPGLYYSYALGQAGRVAFLSRSEVNRRLG